MLGRDKTKKDLYTVEKLLNMFRRGQIDKKHPLQRKPDQWTPEAKSGLAATIIKHEDVDSIKICEQIVSDTKFILWLIDGLQRLTVLEEFKNDGFKMSRTLEMPLVYYQKENEDGEMEVVEYDLRGKKYSDLPEELRDEFDTCSIEVVKHLDCTDEEVAYHIGRYNRQTSMNTNQKNILPMYKVAAYVKEISDGHEFFKNCGCYTENEIKKGVIDRVVSETVMLMYHLDNWKKSKKMALYLNENATKEEFTALEFNLDRLTKIVDKQTTGKLFNSKNSFIWFALFDKFTKLGLEDEMFKKFLEEFQDTLHNKVFEEYEGESFDTYDNNRSTKDKTVVTNKLDMLEKLMMEYFESEDVEINIETDQINVKEDKDGLDTERLCEFVKDNVSEDILDDDVEFYRESLDDYIQCDSRLYDIGRYAVIALLAYAYKCDKDNEFMEWADKYCNQRIECSTSQRVNYIYMKREFDKYLKECNA